MARACNCRHAAAQNHRCKCVCNTLKCFVWRGYWVTCPCGAGAIRGARVHHDHMHTRSTRSAGIPLHECLDFFLWRKKMVMAGRGMGGNINRDTHKTPIAPTHHECTTAGTRIGGVGSINQKYRTAMRVARHIRHPTGPGIPSPCPRAESLPELLPVGPQERP